MLDGIVPTILTELLQRPIVGVTHIDLLDTDLYLTGDVPASMPSALTWYGDVYAGMLA